MLWKIHKIRNLLLVIFMCLIAFANTFQIQIKSKIQIHVFCDFQFKYMPFVIFNSNTPNLCIQIQMQILD